MSDFHLLIRGPGDEPVGRVDLDCEDEQEAMEVAANVISPYGHELRDDGRFLGRFEASWGEHLESEAD